LGKGGRRLRATARNRRPIIVERRRSSAHFRRPWRAGSEYAIDAKCRRFSALRHQNRLTVSALEGLPTASMCRADTSRRCCDAALCDITDQRRQAARAGGDWPASFGRAAGCADRQGSRNAGAGGDHVERGAGASQHAAQGGGAPAPCAGGREREIDEIKAQRRSFALCEVTLRQMLLVSAFMS
jgi:hypothetical protein